MTMAAAETNAMRAGRVGLRKRAGRILRSLMRASAVAGFAVSLGAFVFYPWPWGSHWDPWKLATAYAMSLAAAASLVSLLAGILAVAWSADSRARRPMGRYVVLDLITLVLGMLTPSI